MEIKEGIVYLINVQSIDVNQIDSFIDNYQVIKQQEKNKNFSNDKDKKLHLISLFFIINYLHTNNIPIEYLKYDNDHYLINDGFHYFSISHKDNYVAFICNNNPIGIDIETISNTVDFDVAKKYFCNYLKDLNNEKFLTCWTKAESLLKCSGIPFCSACKIINNNAESSIIDNTYFFKSIKYKNLFITICYKHKANDEYRILELDYLPK